MITIKRFVCNMLQENCYVVYDESYEAVIIDCGAFYDEERQAIVNHIDNKHLRPVRLIATHGHFDHVFGNDTIYDHYQLYPEFPADDEWLATNIPNQYTGMMGLPYNRPTPPLGKMIHDSDTITFGNHQLKVLSTPGHTPGSVIFYCKEEHVCFTGDTLFQGSIGRTDFERGSWEDMQKSLHEIVAKLPTDTRILPGHGPETSIEKELAYNPYLR